MPDRIPPLPDGFELDLDTSFKTPKLPSGFTLDKPQATISAGRPDSTPAAEYPVHWQDRWRVEQGGKGDINTQARMLSNMGYKNVEIRQGDRLFVDGHEFDSPDNFGSWREFTSEIIDNYDLPAGMLKASPLGGLLREGIMATGDEMMRQKYDPQAGDIDYGNIALRSGLGYAGGKIDSMTDAGKAMAKKGIAEGKSAFKKGMQTADGVTMPGGMQRLIADAQEEFLSDTRKYQGIANEMGATGQMMREFGQKPLSENVEYLMNNSPEFVEKVYNKNFRGNRAKAAMKMYDDIGTDIRNFYENTDTMVPVDTIFQSEPYQAFLNKAYDPRVQGNSQDLLQLHDNFIRDLWTHTAVSKIVATTPDIEAVAAREGLTVNQYIAQRVGDVSTATADELKEALAGEAINVKDLWNLRQYMDDKAQYGLNTQDLTHNIAGTRSLAGATRQAIEKGMEMSGDPEILGKVKTFNNLVPVVKSMDADAANKIGGPLNLKSTLYVSAIGGKVYRTLGYLEKFYNNPTTRKVLEPVLDTARGLKGKMQGGEGMSIPGLPGGIPSTAPLRRGIRQDILRQGANSLTADTDISGQLSLSPEPQPAPTPMDMSFLQDFAPPPPQLPRDPELIAAKPEFKEVLLSALHPDTALLFEDAIESRDPLKRKMATIAAMQEAPDLFEKGITGLRSEISMGDHMVLADPAEAKMYQATIKHLYGTGVIDANFYAKQLSALNDPTDMTVFPRPDMQQGAARAKLRDQATPAVSPLEKLRNLGTTVRTPVGERNTHPY